MRGKIIGYIVVSKDDRPMEAGKNMDDGKVCLFHGGEATLFANREQARRRIENSVNYGKRSGFPAWVETGEATIWPVVRLRKAGRQA